MAMIGRQEMNRAGLEEIEMVSAFALDAEFRGDSRDGAAPAYHAGSSFGHFDAVDLPGVRLARFAPHT